MTMSSPLTRTMRNTLVAGLLFVIAVLLALVFLPPLADSRMAAIRARLDEDIQTLTVALKAVDDDLQQMQAAVRGYILTEAPLFLEQYAAAQASLPLHLEQVAAVAPRVDPRLVGQVDELADVVARWQREGGDRQLRLVEQGLHDAAVAAVAAGESQALFDAARQRVAEIQRHVAVVRAELLASAGHARALEVAFTSGLGVLGLAAAGFVVHGFRRMLMLNRAITTERTRGGALSRRLREQLAATDLRNRQLTVLNAVAIAAAQNRHRDQRASHVLASVLEALELPAGELWLREPAPAGWQRLARVPEAGASAEAVTPPAVQIAVREDRILLAADCPPDLQLLDEPASGLVLPLRGRSAPIGALLLVAPWPDYFTTEDLAFLETLAAAIGLVLENAALYSTAQTERRRLQTVFDHSPEGIVVAAAPSGEIVLANQAAVELLGAAAPGTMLHPHPLAGRVFWPGGAECGPADLPLVHALEHGGAPRRDELIIARPDGQRLPLQVTSVPLYNDDGTLQGAMAVFQDLRQFREVERLKSDFVALVSHELRTPLTTIKGCAEALLNSLSPADAPRTHDFLHIIADQSERLHELIDNLLNLSQVEAGALTLRREVLVLPPLIQALLRQLRHRLGGLRIQADLAPDLPPVSADARRIEQVLINILDNARKFAPPGSVITLSAAARADEVRICVHDQGPGIPPAERERVFERFYQVARPGAPGVGGSGLGLAICKALVEAHGGWISIDDGPGGGTLICFGLPALAPTTAANVTSSVAPRPQSGPTRVLAVDDDPAMRRLLESELRRAGYAVEVVVESQAALEAVAHRPPDIVLLDVMLPGIDGFALCRQLREWSSVPIIMLTARTAERDIVLGLQLGADDYVTKPFRLHELVARIEAVLRRAQPALLHEGPTRIQIGGLCVDLTARLVTVDGAPVSLTPTEYGILACLARHAGQALTHSQILQDVWGVEYRDEHQYLWVHITHLRRKIEPDPKRPIYLLTERGVGYRLARQP